MGPRLYISNKGPYLAKVKDAVQHSKDSKHACVAWGVDHDGVPALVSEVSGYNRAVQGKDFGMVIDPFHQALTFIEKAR